MTFEDALASCINLIEQGSTVDECLARYPAHAADLAPMLTLVAAIRTVQRPRLLPAAFARGRAVVAAQLALESPPPAVVPTTELSVSIPAVLAEGRSPTRAGNRRRYTLPQPFSLMHAITTAVAVAVLLLAVYSTVRSVNTSLPGDILYPAKRVTEHVQGSLMVAVGQSAAWHAEQIERRLQESMALQERDGAIAVYLQDDMEERVQFAIDASARMSITKRQIFLENWLYNLRQLQTTSAPQGTAELFGDSSVDAALAQTIRTVETAAGLDPIPVIEPSPTVTLTSTPLPPTVTPSPTPTPTFTPTSTPTQTMAPLPTATAVMPEVVPPTVTMTPTATPAPTDTPVPTDTPAPTNTPQPTATNTRDSSGDPDPDPSTPTPTSPPPTHTPLPPTETPELPVTSTPTAVGSPEGTPEATETLSPDGTPTAEPTSDGSATPQGTGEPTLQPTPEGTPDPDGTPTPTSESTAEVTAEATAETTSTPSPDGTPQPTAEPTAEVTPEATAETTSTPPPNGTPDPTAEPTAEATAGTTSTPTAPPRPTMDATLEPAATGSASTPTSTATPSIEPTSVLQTN